jgi:ribosome biogenesis GTPase A|tara:strand:+ start:2557 stop:2952 length:396 start_codon:yes stop_codon:yes gene_type:complete
MKKKTNIRTVIRRIVREEVAMAIQEVITELKQPSQPQQKSEKIVEKKSFTKDSILNDVLNETAQRDEWKTMGGGKFDSSRMNEIIGSNYGDMMNSQSPTISVDGQTPDFLKKDYSAVVKKGLEIDKQKHRG